MTETARRASWLLLWACVLALSGYWAVSGLRTSGDLRLFMPQARTAEQRLLMDELGEGPAARLLLVAISGDTPERLAERSRLLRDQLRDSAQFALVNNGEQSLDDLPEALLPYRYLLSSRPASGGLSAEALTVALRARLADLGSPASLLLAPLLPRDPTLEVLHLLEHWTPDSAPELQEGVWFSRDGETALLIAETRAAGFDPEGQAAAVALIRSAYADVLEAERIETEDSGSEHSTGSAASAPERQPAPVQGAIEISGPGAFAVRMAEQTRSEASLLGSLATGGLILLLLVAYRRPGPALLGALPLASAVIAGLAATRLCFAEVHGITLAFGFTLIGVAQDYPVHLFSHLRRGESALRCVRSLWPTLATGVGSTCVAYLTFFVTGVPGLMQLAVFTIAGLAAAALTTRYLLPRVLPSVTRDVAEGAWMHRLQQALWRVPRVRGLVPGLIVVSAAVLLWGPAPWWQDDLGRLAPVPAELIARDRALRAELGAPDVRWMLVQHGSDTEQALQRSEALLPALDALRGSGVIEGFDLAARYLPSAATQRARQEALPSRAQVEVDLAAASTGLPFRPDAFAPFLDELDHASRLLPLRPGDLVGTPLELAVGGLLIEREGDSLALVSLNGVRDTEALRDFVAAHPGLSVLDLKAAAESLASAWRSQVLWALAGAGLLLSLTVWAGLRDLRRALRVLLPMALGTALLLAILHGAGVAFTLFHLISLVLAAGLGLDYALFFEHGSGTAASQRRTLHALLVCSASTLLVFALLALSSIPVLRAIGGTVAIGVVCHFVLGLLLLPRPRLVETADG